MGKWDQFPKLGPSEVGRRSGVRPRAPKAPPRKRAAPKPDRISDVRVVTVSKTVDTKGGRTYAYPRLVLSGAWLTELGFTPGAQATVSILSGTRIMLEVKG